MYDTSKVPESAKQKPKQQQQRNQVLAPVLTPTILPAPIPSLSYQQNLYNGGRLPEVHATNHTISTTTATSQQYTLNDFVIGQQQSAAVIPTTGTIAGFPAGGAEAKFLSSSPILTPLPVVQTINNKINLNTNNTNQSSLFLPLSSATGGAATAGAASSGIGTVNFDYRRSLGGGDLNNPFSTTQRTSPAAATASSPDTNPVRLANKNFFLVPAFKDLSFLQAECELAHAQVAGGCIQIKKQKSINQRIIDTGKDNNDSKNNNSNNFNINNKSAESPTDLAATNWSEKNTNSIKTVTNATIIDNSNNNKALYDNNSVSARSGEATAEKLDVMLRVTPDGSHQTTVDTTIATTTPATGANFVYENNKTNLSSPTTTITTSTVNTNTTPRGTPRAAPTTGPSSSKGRAGYLRLRHVQNTPSGSNNNTGSASFRHLQNTSYRHLALNSTSESGAARTTAGGGIPTAIGTGNITNNNIVGTSNITDNKTTATIVPRLVATDTITNNNNNISGNNNNSNIMGSNNNNNNYLNYRHLYGNNCNDENKQQQQKQQPQQQEQVSQQQKQRDERDDDQHDDISFIDSDEITPTKTTTPDITVGSANAQIIKSSPPIYFKPITPFQQRTERGTQQRARPKSTIILPTTSTANSVTTHSGSGGCVAGSSYTFERVNYHKYSNSGFYMDSKWDSGSSKNISGSGAVTIPPHQQREQIAKATTAAGQPTTSAANNIDTLGIKNSIKKFNSLSGQKNQKLSVVSNNATISTNSITTGTTAAPTTTAFTTTTAFGGNKVGGSNAAVVTSGGVGGSSTNIQRRYFTDMENHTIITNSRLDAGYSHSLTRGTHRNFSGGTISHGSIGGRGGFGSGGSHNSRMSTSGITSVSSSMLTNKNVIAGIHHSGRVTGATSSMFTNAVQRPRLGHSHNTNSKSIERSTMMTLNSIDNIAAAVAKPMTMATITGTTTTMKFASSNGNKSVTTNSSLLTTNNKLTQDNQHNLKQQQYHKQQHKQQQQQQYNNDSNIIRYNSSSNSNKISTGAEDGNKISTSSSNNSSSIDDVGGASSHVVTSIASASTTTTPTPETSNANAAAVSSKSSNDSTSSPGTSTQVAVVIANESVRNAAGTSRTILPPVSPTTTATQRYWERENGGSTIRSSHTLPTSSLTTSSLASSKYSSTINDTNKLSNGRDAASEGLCGLRNIGNTCFMNSVIQCLSHTTELTRFLKAHHGSRSAATKDQQILYEFAKLIQEMWTADVHSVTPMELKRAFSTKHRMYSDFNQQDAQEFLRFFLDSLHSALNTGVKNEPLNIDDNLSDNKKADLTWEWYIRHENSLIRELFVGQLKSTLKCTTCGNTSVTFDPFWDLSVSLPSSSRCKLEACLDLFIREEVLDGDEMPTCSKCKTRRKCTKSFTIQRFPKYLVIHLKRFSETRWSKLSNIVEFPTGDRELNMGPYAANLSSSVQYSLYAVSNHMGSTAGGHYVALCKHPVSRKWHEFNDNIVSDPISESHLISSCAYILFYERA